MSSKASERDLSFGKARERIAAELLRRRLWPEGELKPRNEYARIDFGVVDPTLKKPLGFIEVKVRRNLSSDYASTIVSLDKVAAAKNLKQYFHVRTVVLVVFIDRAGYLWLDETPDGVAYVGRADRDGEGTEHAFFNHERFVWVDGLASEVEKQLKEAENPTD